jgi:hypothetical protein
MIQSHQQTMRQMTFRTLTFFCLLLSSTLFGQEKKEKPPHTFDPEKLFFGGNFGMRFGDNTFVNISPQVGYQFSQYFAAGGGVNFITSSQTYRNGNGDKIYKDNYGYAGLSVFARVFPIPILFASVQPEYNYSWGKIKYFNGQSDIKTSGAFVPVLLVGAGAAIPSGRGRLIAMLQYDVIGDARSPYGRNAFFTIGYNF